MNPLVIGQPVWFYADREHVRGMTRIDDTEPFAAIVASAPSDRLVNVLVIDHVGATFPLQSVALFQGDDKDDFAAPCHCELEMPAPKKTVALSGAAGQPTALALGGIVAAAQDVASVRLIFTVPPGETYRFISVAGDINQAFTASPKPQMLMPTSVQVAAGVLTDLSITTANEGDVLLAVAIVELNTDGTIGKKYTFNETVAVGQAVPEPKPAEKPAEPVVAGGHADIQPQIMPPPAQQPPLMAPLA